MSLNEESCLVIAGEKSGEDHAMTFLPELMKQRPHCQFYGVAGDRLKEHNVELLYHLKDFSGIGISEVLSKIPFYYRALGHILEEVDKRKTKSAILIDFQGFNLKLAKKLKERNIQVLYYVAPQAWVWKPWRAKTLEKTVHTLFTILPFEKKWFQDRGVTNVKGVIHPLMIEYKNEIQSITQRRFQNLSERPLKLLLLPGSRNVEVSKLLPRFQEAVELLKTKYSRDIEIGIVKSESVRLEYYDLDLIIDHEWKSNDLKEALNWSDACIAASGTVTLATGLFQVPTVVCYQVSLFTQFILKLLVPYKGPISLTNIIHDNEIVFPELVQKNVNAENIVNALMYWLNSEDNYNKLIDQLAMTKDKLSGDDIVIPDYMSGVIAHG